MKPIILFATILLASFCNAQVHQRVILDEFEIGGESYDFSRSRGLLLNEKSESMFWNSSGPDTLFKTGAQGGQIIFSANRDYPGNRELPYGSTDYRAFNQNGDVAFLAETELIGGDYTTSRNELYLYKNKILFQVAVEGEPAPGGGVFSGSFSPASKISENGIMVFLANTLGGGGVGIYRAAVVADKIVVSKVAVVGDSSPDGGRFESFEDSRYLRVNSQGGVLFGAGTTQDSSYHGTLFYEIDGQLLTALPEGDGLPPIGRFWLSNTGNILINDPIYDYVTIGLANAPRTILLESPDRFPIGTTVPYYDYPVVTDVLSDSSFVFTAKKREVMGSSYTEHEPAIYLWSSGVIKEIAIQSDAPPGGGFYSSWKVLGAGAGWVYFHASLTGGEAIFRGNGTVVERVISTGDFLDGNLVTYIDGLLDSENQTSAVNAKGQILYTVGYNSDGSALGSDSFSLYLWPTEPKPLIQVTDAKGITLLSGKANHSFGKAKIGGKGHTKKFIINNVGSAALTSLNLRLKGVNSKDFKLIQPSKKSVTNGSSISFKVTFQPIASNKREALIQILSNDKTKSPYNIKITGRGISK